jgi:uncharacterized SAM-binding protein YcdF (DUF218 family)
MASVAKSALQTHPRRGWRWLAPALCLAGLVAVVGGTAARVVRQGSRDEARRADAIVVFGAAEYAGRPSPVYRARLDHAYDLFAQGLAPIVITTGGAGADPTYSEGGVGRDYLARRGIPDRCLIAETQGGDTAESAQRVSAILRTNHLHTVLAVSDAYHIFRIKKLLAGQGVVTFGSPRSGSIPRTPAARLAAATREAVSYCVWRVYKH